MCFAPPVSREGLSYAFYPRGGEPLPHSLAADFGGARSARRRARTPFRAFSRARKPRETLKLAAHGERVPSLGGTSSGNDIGINACGNGQIRAPMKNAPAKRLRRTQRSSWTQRSLKATACSFMAQPPRARRADGVASLRRRMHASRTRHLQLT